MQRLVLGCGAVGRTLAGVLGTWPGTLRVVTDDDAHVDSLPADVVEGDPTDPATYPEAADSVVVASDDPEANREAAVAAREAFPTARLTVLLGSGASETTREAVDAVADRVVDPTAVVTERVLSLAAGESAERFYRLLSVLRDLSGPLAVVMHDNPDPDAIAAAFGLCRIAETVGVDADPCYYGSISHQENRALVNLLDLDLRNLEEPSDVETYAGVALVDHSRPGVNDGLPAGMAIDVVVDHHPPRAPVEARFVDLRSEVGATSTLVADYFERFGIDLDRRVATALLYGIRVDTRDFTREVSDADFEAAAFLLSHVDTDVLERVETPSHSPETLDVLALSIRNRQLRGEALCSGVGRVRDRDTLAQAAERLLNMEGVSVVVVHGIVDDTVYVSGRTRGTGVDLGETLRDALGTIGSAGGHADMAGAQIPLGILGAVDDASAESLSRIVDEVISDRVFDSLERAPTAPTAGWSEEIAFEFPLEEDRPAVAVGDANDRESDGEESR
jgi:nanoRNase/pAp phosphatase (c-di-AMP/oligoRNAs hydrolase)